MRPSPPLRVAALLGAAFGLGSLNAAGQGTLGAPWPPPYRYTHAARPLPAARPGERALLTVEHGARRQTFTLRQLQALPALRYHVTHPQMKLPFTYEGVPLRDLAALGGFAGRNLRVYAANGYVTTILAADYMAWPLLLAYAADGHGIPVLQKGPLTVVLPPTPAALHRNHGYAWVWYVNRVTPAP